MAPSPNDETSLKDMKYRDLQRIAKEVGVRANLARPLLIQKILEVKLSKGERGAGAAGSVAGPSTVKRPAAGNN